MSNANIHSTAIIHEGAQLHPSVTVGAYSVIGSHVKVGAGTRIGPHCVIEGYTTIGEDNQIFQFASLGAQLVIGDRNTIREFCTFNTGTAQDSGVTRVGNDNWIMAYVHIAHDCVVGNHTILANNATLAGHVHLGDWVILGGLTGVHQFVKIGAHAMSGFASRIAQDVPPYMMVEGNPLAVRGFNIEGLRRRGFTPERIQAVKQMHKLLYRQGLTLQAAQQSIGDLLTEIPEATADIALMQEFLQASTRGIAR